MSFLQQAPQLSVAEAERLARDVYGLAASASPLPSERDQNFLLESTAETGGLRTGRFVLKIANATEDRAMLEAQNAAMAHVAARVALCPHALPTRSGDLIAVVPGDVHFVRLVTYLEGIPFAEVGARTPALFESLGRAVGRLDRALDGFDHPAIHRDFHWDLARAGAVIQEHLPRVTDHADRQIVERITRAALQAIAAHQPAFRRSAVHHDANDWNVLVSTPDTVSDPRIPNPELPTPEVVGIIDFGDMVHSWTVADPAVAVAYAMLDAADPLAIADAVMRGYQAEHPLLSRRARGGVPVGMPAAVHERVHRRVAAGAAVGRRVSRGEPAADSTHVAGAGRDPGAARMTNDEILAARRRFVGGNVSVGYRRPLQVVRGAMQYLFDEAGRRYIDAYNNVPHVGHCHPRVVEAAAAADARAQHQHALSRTSIWPRYAERLAATLPEPLRVCYFVNSGSEANELALRLARAHTRQRDLIVLDAAYHGNTTTLIDISPYKFNGPGGGGRPPWVHVVPIPDVYRGP